MWVVFFQMSEECPVQDLKHRIDDLSCQWLFNSSMLDKPGGHNTLR